jgi:hypothetical protein
MALGERQADLALGLALLYVGVVRVSPRERAHWLDASLALEEGAGPAKRARAFAARGVQELDRHAASSYSWIRPPSRSRRFTWRACGVTTVAIGERILESGGFRSSAR